MNDVFHPKDTTSNKSHSESNKKYEIPNYDMLYKHFITQLELNKALNKKNTKVKPFVLKSSQRIRSADAVQSRRVKNVSSARNKNVQSNNLSNYLLNTILKLCFCCLLMKSFKILFLNF